MNLARINLIRWANVSAVGGALLWLALFAAPIDLIQHMLLLAVLVVTPLVLPLIADTSLLFRITVVLQPLCAAIAVASFFLSQGFGAAAAAAPWLMLSDLLALYGLSRLWRTRLRHIDELCIDAALLYLPVGAIWLVLSRLGGTPFGFGEPIITLTAIHFHYAGFATPILVALTGRQLIETRPTTWPAYRIAALGVIAGPPLLAIGITFSPLIEVIAALWLSASLALLALLVLFAIVPRTTARLAQTLLIISCVASLGAMIFAALYALGEFTGNAFIDIPQMVRLHGLANSLGFVICGAFVWRSMQRKASFDA